MTAADDKEIKAHIWNGWSFTRDRHHDGNPSYIIHMFEEGKGYPTRSLCGVRIAESGLVNLNEVEPGCMKCRRILEKRGLLSPRKPST